MATKKRTIRLTKEQKEILSAYIYDIANRELALRNPCEWTHGTCKMDRQLGKNINNAQACCGGCDYHQAKEGCTTKSLWCKLWLCPKVCKENPDIEHFMRALREMAWYLGIKGGVREPC